MAEKMFKKTDITVSFLIIVGLVAFISGEFILSSLCFALVVVVKGAVNAKTFLFRKAGITTRPSLHQH